MSFEETHPTIDEWLDHYEGRVSCACDHGCNQYDLDAAAKISLITRAMRLGSPKSILDKLAQLPFQRANRIWYFLKHRESRVLNKVMDQDHQTKTFNFELIKQAQQSLWKKRKQD